MRRSHGHGPRIRGSLLRAPLCATVMLAALSLAACSGSVSAASNSPSPSSVPGFTDTIGGSSPSAAPAQAATPLPTPTVTGTIAFAKMLVRASGYHSDMFVVRPDGTGLKRLTRDAVWKDHPSWSPDGRRIVYDVWPEDSRLSSTIRVINADGSGRARLTMGALHGVPPAWSPDGKRIAFWKEQSGGEYVYVMNADGSGVRPVAGGIPVWRGDVGPSEAGGGLGWTPDGKILYLRSGDVWAVSPDGTGRTRLTKHAELGTFSLSPDGKSVALLHDRESRLYAIPVQGTGPAVTLADPLSPLVHGTWVIPSWSPDGKTLAFATSSLEMVIGSNLYVVNADGPGLSQVPGVTDSFDPAWRPQ